MSDTSVLPASLAVRSLFEDLLGRDCTVGPGEPLARLVPGSTGWEDA